MFSLTVENEYREKMEITHNRNYKIYNITGLNPPNATINSSVVTAYDGEKFNSSRVDKRNIVIEIVPEGDVEKNRIRLYRYLKVKRYCKVYYKNGIRDVYIEGYVESMQIGYFDMKQKVQVSIVCPQPYFKSIEEIIIDFQSITNEFYFPFAIEEQGIPFSIEHLNKSQVIENEGDVESGIVIRLEAINTVVNPTIYNEDTRESIGLNIEMQEADTIEINTNNGKKRIWLTRAGEAKNIINSMKRGSKWLKIQPGKNTFTFDAVSFAENLIVTFQYDNQYEGV